MNKFKLNNQISLIFIFLFFTSVSYSQIKNVDSFIGYNNYKFGMSHTDCSCDVPISQDWMYECDKYPINSFIDIYQISKITLGFYSNSKSLNRLGIYFKENINEIELLIKLEKKYGPSKIIFKDEFDIILNKNIKKIDCYIWEGEKILISLDLVENGKPYLWFVYKGEKVTQGF